MPTFEHEIDNWDGKSPLDFDSEDYKVFNVIVEFTVYGEYRPAVWYLSNGDPGYPAEYPELDDMKIFDETGKDITSEVLPRWIKVLENKCIEEINNF